MMEAKEPQSTEAAVADMNEEGPMNNPATAEHPYVDHDAWNDAEFRSIFDHEEAEQFRADWLELQSRFVDNPNGSVRDADELVNQMIENITAAFTDQRIMLGKLWRQGDHVSTEDLRVTLKRYRFFFERLLDLAS